MSYIKPITNPLASKPTWWERNVIRWFHQLYYSSRTGGRPWNHTFWMGTRLLKCPLDLWIYQEMLHELKPDFIIETGTAYGGSALYMASLCDLLGHGNIITIDIEHQPNLPQHPRIKYILGSSTDSAIIDSLKQTIAGAKTVLLILDSDHSRNHVLNELRPLTPLVTPGSYCIVEDSNVNGHPVNRKFGPGPMEAIDTFLSESNQFQVDSSREKFFLTFNPRGYLKRI